MKTIKKLGVLSVAKIQGVIMAFIGLLYGIVYTIFGNLSDVLAEAGAVGVGLGYAGIIILPFFYGIFGFIGGAFVAFLYNNVADRVGGIQIELK
ncbi:hypothetical protein CEE44_01455 [Candidatus Woesearchaeota archaeon B3_Woes]|nr:MAG: hypothetical protein CEE44_01455 [Candidatus Woesearchaeota archaeon B3_Woes]